MKQDGTWDIRTSPELLAQFDRTKPYYFKVNREQAIILVRILSDLYGITPAPVVVAISVLKAKGANAAYNDSGEIEMYSMNHCKSIFHEMYHDLDWKTNHLYISDDHTHNPKYPNGYGWAFAELLWAKIREELSRPKQSGSLLTAFTD